MGTNVSPADRLPAVRAFFNDRGTGWARTQTALTCLENWVNGGAERGQRSWRHSDDGIPSATACGEHRAQDCVCGDCEALTVVERPHCIELVNKHPLGERGERVYGATMGDALAQAAQVVECDPGLEADLEACGQ